MLLVVPGHVDELMDGAVRGGKESQANHWAALAALAASVTGHACKLRLDRAHSVRFWRDAHPLESARATLPCVGFIAFGTVAIAGSVLQVLYPGEQ